MEFSRAHAAYAGNELISFGMLLERAGRQKGCIVRATRNAASPPGKNAPLNERLGTVRSVEALNRDS
jgi:hypothetical protein